MQAKALEKVAQPSKEPQVEQNDLRAASAHTLTEPDETTAFEFDAAISSTVVRKRSAPVKKIQTKGPLSPEMLDKMQRYWQAANYLTVGQIYLSENPLLREPLKAEHIKPRLLGHWGTSAGQKCADARDGCRFLAPPEVRSRNQGSRRESRRPRRFGESR
jgi:hypothetical protein